MHYLPKDKTFVTFCEGDKSDNDRKAYKLMSSHKFAQRVQLIVPESCSQLVEPSPDLILTRYRIQCSLLPFISKQYIDSWIKHSTNSCTIVSRGKIDHEDVIAMVDGQLYMSLTKEMHQRAGLHQNTRKSKFDKKNRVFIHYDMRATSFSAGQSSYDRLVWSLNNTPLGTTRDWDVVVGKGGKLDDSLVRLFSGEDGSGKITRLEIKPKFKSITATAPESFSPPKDHDYNYRDEWAACFHEWTALVSLNSEAVNPQSHTDPYLRDYQVLDPSPQPERLRIITWGDGLMSNEFLTRRIWPLLENEPKAIVTVHGLEDTPVAWNNKEHTVFTSGDNLYSIVKDQGSLVMFKHLSGRDLE